jgi:membrane peptidoglycan carboxypeptidase
MRSGGVPLYKYANIGAILEKPGTGAIVAMYGGPNYAKRQLNMATQSRNQVGSSFKPYVLATAVHEGMNVKTSILDGYSAICSPDDQFPMVPSVRVTGITQASCPTSPPDGWYNFSSDEADGPVSVAQASALSLNTAYGDLIHRVGTQNVIDMAKQFGVNTADYPAGSGLQHMLGQSGIALGQASLTVEEQANTFAALAADGEYATPHVISKITTSTGTQVPLRIVKYPVLTPGEAADVDYALSFDTIYGTATNAAMTDGRSIIGKTGTTNNAQSAFFIGAIPQYSLAVGIFTNTPQTQSLNGLGGQAEGGYGGTWPALIWHTFAEKEFAQLPIKPLPTPPFSGSKWVQVPPAPVHHHHHASPSPSPSPSCTPALGQQPCPTPSQTPGPSPSPSCTQPFGCRPHRG